MISGDWSSIKGVYMRNIPDIPQKWKDIRNADIMPNWVDMCNNVDIQKLYAIARR
jgi:hypothetical protein